MNIIMTSASECVINEIIFENSKPYVKRDFYNFGERKFFFSWEFDEKGDIRLRNDSETFRKLAKDTLLVIYPKDYQNLMSPRIENYRAYDVYPVKKGYFFGKGYQFRADYRPEIGESMILVYHPVLPDYCYVDKNSIRNDDNTGHYIVTQETRQSVTWVRGSGNPPQQFQATFICEGEKKFKDQLDKVERVITVSPKVKQIAGIAKDIGTEVATEAVKKIIASN